MDDDASHFIFIATMLFHAMGCVVSFLLGYLHGGDQCFKRISKLRIEERARDMEREKERERIWRDRHGSTY